MTVALTQEWLAPERIEDIEDHRLVELCREPGRAGGKALRELFGRYRPRIHRTCLTYLRNPEAAEDACHDVLLRLMRSLNRFEEKTSFGAWVHRIAYNHCMSELSRAKRRAELLEVHVAPFVIGSVYPDIEVSLDRQRRVRRALDLLTATDRQIIILRFFHELSLEEIADRHGVGLSVAKMRLYRAMERFRGAFGTEHAL